MATEAQIRQSTAIEITDAMVKKAVVAAHAHAKKMDAPVDGDYAAPCMRAALEAALRERQDAIVADFVPEEAPFTMALPDFVKVKEPAGGGLEMRLYWHEAEKRWYVRAGTAETEAKIIGSDAELAPYPGYEPLKEHLAELEQMFALS
jgi:hypothetical protein